ncbi:formylglycine-generating enzyme family protein [Niabella hibiscisoli]|uniref:formylglycine-generating enzyme family protein n=1 Tax=Niabella hibiscisoli TaxID=1825928 RepID=UPI00374D7468
MIRYEFFTVGLSLLCLSALAQQTAFEKYQQKIPGSAVQFEMVPVKAGSFLMGSGKAADEKPHQVSLSAFWMGAREVTHDEFALYLNDETYAENSTVDAITRPSRPYIEMTLGMGKEGGFPANSMKQHGALMYCKWLYEKQEYFTVCPQRLNGSMPAKRVLKQLTFSETTVPG